MIEINNRRFLCGSDYYIRISNFAMHYSNKTKGLRKAPII